MTAPNAADFNWFMPSELCDVLNIEVPIVLAPFGRGTR